MKFRFLPAGFLLCAFVLLGAAGIAYLRPADEPGVTIQEPEREFPACAVGQKLEVAFRIHNPLGYTVRVVGLAQC